MIVIGAGIAGLAAAYELQQLSFEVVVVEARGLAAKDKGGTSDPFCRVELLSLGTKAVREETTKVIDATIAPVWNDAYSFVLRDAQKVTHLHFEVRDKDAASSQFLGEAFVCLDALIDRPALDEWIALAPRPDLPHKAGDGDIHIKLDWMQGVLPKKRGLLSKVSGAIKGDAGDRDALDIVRQKATLEASKFGVAPDAGATLRVTVHEARDLLPIDEDGSIDAFVQVETLDKDWKSAARKKTKPVRDSFDPDFEQVFVFPLAGQVSHVRVDVRNHEALKSDSLGCVVLPVGKLMRGLLVDELLQAAKGLSFVVVVITP